jgi:Cu(I)/Ag(I) efflux system membrane fusion protein
MKRFLAVVLLVMAASCAPKKQTTEQVTQDGSGRRVIAWIDPMYAQGPPHLYKSKHPGIAPDCGMKLVPQYAEESPSSSSVTIPHEQQHRIGVRLATAEVRELSKTIRTTGRVTADERRVAQVRAKFDGFVDALYVNFTGQPVRQGEPLLAIYSPDLLATQNELVLAERNHSDLGKTLAGAARARLRLWDMSAADIDRVARSGQPMRDVILRSPASGVVTAKNAVAGARVMPADMLYEVTDLSHVWVIADIYESDLPAIRVGTAARVVAGGRTVNGRVAFIGPSVAAQTRTASVRIDIDNRSGVLKPDMFAEVILETPDATALAVPDSAVMNTGSRSIAFVALPNGSFDPREVTTGAKADGFYAIRSGLQPGERVVVDANFLVDSESRLKSAMSQMQRGTP